MAFYQNVPDRHPRRINYGEKGAWEEEGSRYRTGKDSSRGQKDSGRSGSGSGEFRKQSTGRLNREYREQSNGRPNREYREQGTGRPNREYREQSTGRSNREYREQNTGRQSRDYREQNTGRRDRDEWREPVRPSRMERPEETEEKRYTDYEYAPVRTEQAEEDSFAQNYILTGRNPIREALKNDRDLEKLLVQKGELSGSARAIVQEAKERKVMVQVVEKSRLDEIAPQHQGLIAFASAYQYATVEEILETAKERGEDPFLILLDGITDPHNLGAIIRSAECAGAHGVIVPQHRSVGLTPAAVKASAGAIEYMKVARVTNLNRTIEDLQRRGIWVYAVTMDGQDYLEVPFDGATALVIGAEGEGISRLTTEKCDMNVSLPMSGHLDSLNASVAAGVMMYRVMAARKGKG